ncbi:hypothetical protein WOLCODRAFT_28877, partial [Wolfiporia cocos MD-104 SS10]
MSPCEVVEKNGWGPCHRHRHVRHTVRIGVRNARWLGFRQRCQDHALFTCASRCPRARERRSETSQILLRVRVPLPQDMSRALV